jgi:predicted nucleic acid-binding protein
MRLCEEESVDVKREIHYYLDKYTRIQMFTRSKYPYDDIDKYITADVGLTFDDFITLGFMKQKGIRTIVSFNQAFDKVNGINRVYDLDEYNPHRLNFFKYE